MPKIILDVPGIFCPNCATPIESALRTVKGVRSAQVNTLTKQATVNVSDEYINDQDSVFTCFREALDGVGYELGAVSIDNTKTILLYWLRGLLGFLTGLAFMLLSIYGMGIPLLFMYLFGAFATALTLYLGKDSYKTAYTQFRKNRRLTMESLFTVSTSIALVVSVLSFFFPTLPMMFDAALWILGFKNIGAAIQESANKKFGSIALTSNVPAEIEIDGTKTPPEKKAINDLVPGDIIIVRRKQTVPVNAKLLKSMHPASNSQGFTECRQSEIYNKIVTGRTLPQPIFENDPIMAGCVVPGNIDFIRMEVTATVKNSYLATLEKRLKQAESEKAEIEETAQKALQYFVPTVFAIAFASVVFVSLLLSPFAAIQCGIAILVSSCPCALGLIIPWAFARARQKAAQHGAVFKNGKCIEAATKIRKVVFDLTGTLTTGTPTVVRCTVPSEMLAFLAAIEKKIDHPVPKAICRYVEEQKKEKITIDIDDVKITQLPHSGVVAEINEDEYIIGNRELMQSPEINVNLDPFEDELRSIDHEHAIFFVKNKKVLGYVLLEDPLRDDAAPLVKHLIQTKKEVYLCTGADEPTAKKQAKQLGIKMENVWANCIKEDDKHKIPENSDLSLNEKKEHRKSDFVYQLMQKTQLILKNDVVKPQNSDNGHLYLYVDDQGKLVYYRNEKKYLFIGLKKPDEKHILGLFNIVPLNHDLFDLNLSNKQRQACDQLLDIAVNQGHAQYGNDVAVVGDGTNDLLPIKYARCGIAITSESGSAATQEAANVLVNPNSLSAVANTFEIAEQATSNIKQNLAINLSYNLLAVILFSGLLVTLGFMLNPAIGAALMVAQILFIIMNVERFNCQPVTALDTHKPRFMANTNHIKRRVSWSPHYRATAPDLNDNITRHRSISCPLLSKKNIFTKEHPKPPASSRRHVTDQTLTWH